MTKEIKLRRIWPVSHHLAFIIFKNTQIKNCHHLIRGYSLLNLIRCAYYYKNAYPSIVTLLLQKDLCGQLRQKGYNIAFINPLQIHTMSAVAISSNVSHYLNVRPQRIWFSERYRNNYFHFKMNYPISAFYFWYMQSSFVSF